MRTGPLHLLLVLLSVATARADDLPAAKGSWFRPQTTPKGVALVVHGLNLKPQRMDALARCLSEQGIEALRLTLSGHDDEGFDEVSAARWTAEARAGYRAAARRAARLGVPVFLVGYSLGGLLGEVLLADRSGLEPIHFDRVVLLAPAIALRPAAHLVRALFPFGDRLALPSANALSYRSHARTSVAAYRALLALLDRVRQGAYRNADVPTLVLVRSDDELVSPRRLDALVRDHHLTRWSVRRVSGRSPRGYPHHLIVDSTTAGATGWAEMKAMIIEHLLYTAS